MSIKSVTIGNRTDVKEIKIGNGTYFKKEDGPNYLCFTAEEAGSTVKIQKVGSAPTVSLEYSTDKKTWNTFTVGTTVITLSNIGDKVYLRGNGNTAFGSSKSAYNKFVMSGKIAASGNTNTLLDYDEEIATLTEDYCYGRMFSGCTGLITAPELPATTLANYCYQFMFYGCIGLTTAPELPATTLANYCYGSMFSGCTGLITAPELPATTLVIGCYSYMFKNCAGLITAPELPAKPYPTMYYCYSNMFYGCTHLIYIKVHFTTWNGSFTDSWVSSVSSTGTFVCPLELPQKFGDSNIPTGWTVETF